LRGLLRLDCGFHAQAVLSDTLLRHAEVQYVAKTRIGRGAVDPLTALLSMAALASHPETSPRTKTI
jgi:hypothetical protein